MGDLKQSRSSTRNLNFYSRSNEHPQPNVIGEFYAQWEIQLVSVGFTEMVKIEVSRVEIDNQGYGGDVDTILISDNPHVTSVVNQYSSFDFRSRYSQSNMHSDWQLENLVNLQERGLYGSASRTLWLHAIAWYGLVAIGTISFLYILVMLYVRSLITRGYSRVIGRICPSCDYSLEGAQTATCPECGINVVEEARLLHLLHTRGYRGLKLYMTEYSGS